MKCLKKFVFTVYNDFPDWDETIIDITAEEEKVTKLKKE